MSTDKNIAEEALKNGQVIYDKGAEPFVRTTGEKIAGKVEDLVEQTLDSNFGERATKKASNAWKKAEELGSRAENSRMGKAVEEALKSDTVKIGGTALFGVGAEVHRRRVNGQIGELNEQIAHGKAAGEDTSALEKEKRGRQFEKGVTITAEVASALATADMTLKKYTPQGLAGWGQTAINAVTKGRGGFGKG